MTSRAPGPPTGAGAGPHTGAVIWRAILTALFLLVPIALLNFYVELDWGINRSGSSMFSSGVPAVSLIAANVPGRGIQAGASVVTQGRI